MRNLLLLPFCCLIVLQLFSQTTGRIENLKDGWGVPISYIGEIKNKQPNGVGVAIYNSGNAVRYVGNFANGQYNGKGTLVFSDGSFLTGEWKNGKLNGKATSLNKDGDLYYGYYVDGKKHGRGSYIYSDKGILTGEFKNDAFEGRCIFVASNAQTLADNIYVNSKKNGAGYQYEVDTKTLFEGTWADGKWQSAGKASFGSFLKNPTFYAEQTPNQIIMGGIDKTDKNRLRDTAFFFNLNKRIRYFGRFEKGFMTNGILVSDSIRYFGGMNEKGATGPGVLYRLKHFYNEGNFVDDYLNGANTTAIDLVDKTVYYGGAVDRSILTGKGWFANKYNELYVGEFKDGIYSGPGYIIFKNGKSIKGVFRNGRAVSVNAITDENGALINQKPKTVEEALNLITNDYSNNFFAFRGSDLEENDDSEDIVEKSLLTFPGSVSINTVIENEDAPLAYIATLYKGSNFDAAKKQYDRLCNDIASAHVNKNIPSGIKSAAARSQTTRTRFSVPGTDCIIYAEIKYENSEYTVNAVLGDVELF